MTDDYRIEGAAVHGIADLYAQLDALLMADASWTLGPSLDALHDVLHRFDGEGATFVWADHEHSREALGVEETRRWLQAKLDQPGRFDQPRIRRQLDELLAGTGTTYFELVLEVFAEHPGIRLELR
ncbi:ribonuclease inhibitor [Agrococcus baldri]|uniref:ribonuclease inhibitor n=1 Tax=Agrococcus baldri TaxID=153730 RepID=UPI0011BE55D9|nr:ribonuclease inhibitor [Agrococcus baldri]